MMRSLPSDLKYDMNAVVLSLAILILRPPDMARYEKQLDFGRGRIQYLVQL